MFIQVIKGTVVDVDRWNALEQRWQEELRPGATGFLGSTEGVTDGGTFVVAVRFESAEAARANSARPEQDAWWSDMSEVVRDVEVHDCSTVITLLGGGSDDAGPGTGDNTGTDTEMNVNSSGGQNNSTNDAGQSGLTLIEILALVSDALPNELPPAPAPGGGGRGGRGGRGGAEAAAAPGGTTAPPAQPPAKQ